MTAFHPLRPFGIHASILMCRLAGASIMEERRASNRFNIAKLFSGAMILVGVYATLRYGTEWAYALGKLVGSN